MDAAAPLQILDLSMIKSFQSVLGNAKHIVVLTGDAYIAESCTYARTQVCLRHSLPWRCIDICALHIGAGTSAESGIPTFRGAGGLWRQYEASDLGNTTSKASASKQTSCNLSPGLPAATPEAFVEDPSLVWEFYHWRREV